MLPADQLTALLQSSSAHLSAEDLGLWARATTSVPDGLLSSVADFLSKNGDALPRVTDMLKKKAAALDAGDERGWADALAEEQTYLERYAS